jgi:hypothetical protein
MSAFYSRQKGTVEKRTKAVQTTKLQKHLKNSGKHFTEEFLN